MSDIAWDIPAGDLHPAIAADICTYLPTLKNAYLLQHNAIHDRRSKSKIYLHWICTSSKLPMTYPHPAARIFTETHGRNKSEKML